MVDNTYKANNTFFEDKYIQFFEVGFPSLANTDANYLFAAGDNSQGQLGIGNISDVSSPVQVDPLPSWKKICSGGHVLAIKTNGTLWAWGSNGTGQLGLNDITNRSSPVQVGSSTNWKELSFDSHAETASFAINNSNELYAWGFNNYGQLGLGDITRRSVPVQVGSLSNWKSVDCSDHTLAIKTDGTLWAWGYNHQGQLGLGNIVHRSSPVQVGALTNWAQAVVGTGSNSFAVKTDGTLWAWGNGYPLVAGGAAISSPVQVGSLTNWYQVSSVQNFYAVKTDGTLWASGGNSSGQLGLGDTTTRSSPVQVGLLTNWSKVVDIQESCLAIKTDGTLWAWGRNSDGQLGLGDLTPRSSPVQVGSLTSWRDISGRGYNWHGLKSFY